MIKKSLFLTLIFLFSHNLYALTDKEWAWGYLITHQLGTQSAYNIELAVEKSASSFSKEFNNLIAEQTWKIINSETSDKGLIERMYNILQETAGPEHSQALLSISEHVRLKRGVKNQLKDFAKEASEKNIKQYQFGSLDIEKIKENYSSFAKQAPVSNNDKEIFSSITIHQNMKSVFEIMGKPHAATATVIKIPFVKTVPRISYFYKGLGRIATEYNNGEWLVTEKNPGSVSFEFRMPYFDTENSQDPYTRHIIMHGILQNDYFIIKNIASILNNQNNVDNELLDVFARILEQNNQLDLDGNMDDAMAWIVKLLVNHNGPRYKNLLDEVANNDTNPKASRYAEKLSSDITSTSKQGFQPESINLDTLRKEFLSPYNS